MNISLRVFRLILIGLTMVVFSGISLAQPGNPNGGDKPGTVPISGIEWLLLSGGLLGARKLYFNFKKR